MALRVGPAVALSGHLITAFNINKLQCNVANKFSIFKFTVLESVDHL